MWTNVSRSIGAREAGVREIVLAGRCAKGPKSLIRAGRMAAHVRSPGPRWARADRGPGDGPRSRRDAHARASADVDETVRRAHEAVSLRGDMALVGAVQGGLHPDLRERCARSVSSLDVAVCAIGGVVPLLETYRFRDLVRVIIASKKGLDPSKPVHLFGAGHPLVFPLATLLGCDLFDSASYAKYARDGRMLFADGTRRAADVRESSCLCPVCTAHPMEKIAAEETLLAEHNLHACSGAIREARQPIGEGDLWGLAERRARAHPALLDATGGLPPPSEFLGEVGPGFPPRALTHRRAPRARAPAPPPGRPRVPADY